MLFAKTAPDDLIYGIMVLLFLTYVFGQLFSLVSELDEYNSKQN